MKPVIIGDATLYCADCMDVLPTLGRFDAVITDPPYPDWLADEYKYFDGILAPLEQFDCKQLIFWSTKCAFPLDYTARHVWDKKTGCGSEYEFLFERNGAKNFKVIRFYLINSDVAASYTGDVWTGHKSQKPIGLMRWCLDFMPKAKSILDPFMGSGTTGVAAIQMGRKVTGIEREERYFEIACRRIEQAYAQGQLFAPEQPKQIQEALI